jgi:hypothetical protein
LKKLLVGFACAVLCVFSLNSAFAQRFWIATVPGNWSNTANWSNASNGGGGFSVPGPGDAVTFSGVGGRTGNCLVDINPGAIAGLTIAAAYTGTVNLNGFTLTTTGTNALTGGTVNGGAASPIVLNTPNTSTFSGTVFNVPLTGTSGRLIFNGSTFNQSVTLTKTGATDDDCVGNNTFAAAVTLQNNTVNHLRLAVTTRDIFNSTATFNINSTGAIEIAYGSATSTQFNDNVTVNYLTTGPFRIGASTGKSTMASGKLLTLVPGGSGTGSLTLGGITFSSGQTLALTGNTAASMSIRTSATFNGNTSLIAPTYQIATAVFNGPLAIEKTGASIDDLTGGNTFVAVTATNSGDGQFNWAAVNPDTFNGDLTFNNTAGGRIQLVIGSTGTVVNGTLTSNHGGSTAGINNIFSRSTGATLTINGNVFLNQTNADASSGIIVGNDGNVTINGNVTLTSSAGRGILFAAGATATVTIGANGSNYSLSATPSGFTAGVLSLQQTTIKGTATQTVETGGTAVFNIGSLNVFEGPVDFRGRQITLDASDFRASTYIEKTGSVDNGGLGGSTFAGPTTIRNSGSGAFYTNAGHTFGGQTKIQNTGANYISMEHVSGSTYNGPVEFTNSGSSTVRVARGGNTTFNDNMVVNSSGGNGIYFCENGGTTTATLVTGKTITTTGFTAGELRLQYFTQQGTTLQSLTFVYPGTGLLTLGPSSSFGGDVTFSAPRVLLNGTLYSGTASITKTGAANDLGSGGNTFQGATTIANSGSAILTTGDITADIYNGVLTANNTGSSTIRFANTALGTQFNNNIILNTASGNGIYFGNGNGSSTLANDKTITAGSVLTGDIRLIKMTQTSSVVQQVLNLDGIAILTIGPGSQFGGDVDFRAPQLYLNGCIYGTSNTNVARLEKEGATDNSGNGGNVFNSVTTIINSGSANLRSAGVNPDIFNANLFVNNTSSGAITLSYTALNNQYNGNIQFTNALGGVGITFGQNGGTSTLNTGGALSIGAAGFVSGDLRFMRFTQVGSTMQSLTLTPPASGVARLRLGPASSFDGVVDFHSPRILLEGVTCNDVTTIEKTGATDDTSAGGNVFNGVTTIKNSGTGWIINADVALDKFNNDLTLTNTNSAGIRMADNIPGSLFNGDITVNSTFGQGIWFCDTNAAATATLASGKVVKIGVSGFTSGDLRLRRFTTLGTTAQNLVLGTSAGLRLGPTSDFGGDVNFKAGQLFINTGSIYRGVAILEKTGSTSDAGSGGSTFMGVTSIKNSGTGYLRTNGGNIHNGPTTLTNTNSNDLLLELTTGSTYNDNVDIINTGSSQIRVGYTGTTAFNGNITLTNTGGTGINFGETATNINLADLKTISVVGGATGFTLGTLTLSHFNQIGTGTPQTITMGGTSILTFNGTTTFNSNLTTSSPRLNLNGAIFQGTTSFTKAGSAASDVSTGGNQFNGTTTFTNSATGGFRLAGTTADTYGGNVTFVRSASTSGAIEPAYAGNNTFAGNVAFSSGSTPTLGGGTGIQTFIGSATQTISKVAGTISPQFNRLVVNKTANGITLNTDMSVGVSGTFTNGVITSTAANYIAFINGTTVSGASTASYVSGPVRKVGTDNFMFPLGKNGIYKPIGIASLGATSSQYVAEYFNAVQTSGTTMGPGLDHVSGCEYWIMNRLAGTSTPTVTLSWKNSDCPNTYVQNTTDLRVASYNTTLTRWEDRGNSLVTPVGSGLPNEGTITSSPNVAIFGAFALATSTGSNALPIQLLSFSATNLGSFVSVNWTTTNELNNDYFTIQRSVDGGEFSKIAMVKGAGTSTRDLDYTFSDIEPLNGISYYRLKQTDFDGKSTYSDVVKINRDEEPTLMVSPNPMIGKTATMNVHGTFQVINSVGQVMFTKENSNEFDVSTLSAGVYLIRSASGQVCRLVIN